MPTTYERADRVVLSLLKQVLTQHHADLVEVETKFSVLMASAAKDEHGKILSPALKLHGVPCAATVRIIPYRDRAAGREDAEIIIDADQWSEASDPKRFALLDHEATHLEVQRDEEGNPKSDDAGRPKLKMRHHDHDFGWFDVIARRHGAASYEVEQARAFADEHGQTYFGWSEPPAHGVENAPSPDAKSFDEQVDEAMAGAQVLAVLPGSDDDSFDDGRITDPEQVASFLGEHSRFIIDVGRCGNGQWAERHVARLADGRKYSCDSTGYQGRHASRAEAITSAADTIDDWMRTLKSAGKVLPVKVLDGCREIRGELDKLDKSLAGAVGSAEQANREAVAAV